MQTPPTLDYGAFRESLDATAPDMMSRGGSDLGVALREATKAFPVENNYKAVVLLTDGEDLGGHAIDEAKKASKEGVKVFAIGLGTPEGDYLRQTNDAGIEEYMRDADGQPIRTKLDEATLREIVEVTGGTYARLNQGELDRLNQEVIATLPRSERESELQEIRIERFQVFIAIASAALLIELLIRRRSTQLLALLLLASVHTHFSPSLNAVETPIPELEPAVNNTLNEAQDSSPPEVHYNNGQQSLASGDFAQAVDQLDAAIRQSDRFGLQRDALYNKAHAVFQTGEQAFQAQDFPAAIEQWKTAEALFNSAHEIDSSDLRAKDDAQLVRQRREALEEFLEQQEQQEQQEQESEQQEDGEQEEQNQEQESGDQNDEQQQSDESDQSGDSEQQAEENDSGDQEEQSDSQQSEQGDSESEQQDGQQSEGSEQQQDASQGDSDGETSDDGEESMPLPQPNSETPESPEEENNQGSSEVGNEAAAPEPSNATASPAELDPESIKTEEARALLDSLRNAERFLPMAQPEESQENEPTKLRDW